MILVLLAKTIGYDKKVPIQFVFLFSDLEASTLSIDTVFLADLITSVSFTLSIENVAASDPSNDIASVLAGEINYDIILLLSDADIGEGGVDTLRYDYNV